MEILERAVREDPYKYLYDKDALRELFRECRDVLAWDKLITEKQAEKLVFTKNEMSRLLAL